MSVCSRLAPLALLLGPCCLPGFSSDVALEVQPTPIVVSSSNFTVEARVLLRNSGSETLQHVSLAQFSNDGVKAEVGKPSSTRVCPKREIEWTVKISGPGNAHFPGAVIFEAQYISPSGRRRVYAPLTLQTDGAQKAVEASLEGNFDAVSQQRPASAYLLVTNNLDVPVRVSVTHQTSHSSIIVADPNPFPLPAHATAANKIDVSTKSRVTPGVYPIVFEVTVVWDWAGRKEQRRFAISKPATIGVFFESELLKALGVPSLLVLPGALMVFAFQFLLSFNILRLKDYSKLPDLGPTSPGFWILSVSFSAIFAWLYYLVTNVNYLQSYGVDDLRNVWLSSIPIGFLFYIIIARATKQWRRTHVPSTPDDPVAILKKLAANNLGISLPHVIHHLGNQDLGGFVIERIEDGMTMLWIAPHILVHWQAGAAERAAFQTEHDGLRRPAELARILENARAHVTLEWEANGVVPNPYHVKLDAITQYQPADLIVAVV